MGYIDCHTHILPNIDDGVLTFEQVDKMLEEYSQAGFSRVVCTPHLYNPYVKTNVSAIKDTFDKVNDIASNYNIQCLLGSEYYYYNQPRIIGIPIELKYQLVELPTTLPPKDYLQKFEDLINSGLKIILAHVERFPFLQVGSPDLEKLIKMGVLIQVNVSSLANDIGTEFLDNQIADLIATDNHGNYKLPLVFLEQLSKYPYLNSRMEKLNI